ncbi:MAG: hypothetical protein P4L67_01660 [Candidatus Pacebacteria bacterium]|nr:hypothetical protein [Candidatus Paceibacterota bacterium]
MESNSKQVRQMLAKKGGKVREAPEGFAFYVSLHDFIEYIESTPSFEVFFKGRGKGSRAKDLAPKYFVLKQVYQGIEDIDLRTTDDLGHDRYVAIRELGLIRKKDISENNSFWKRREQLKKVAGEVHKTLDDYLSGADGKK